MADGLARRIERWTLTALNYLTAVLFFVLLLITCTDVIGRYFFNSPLYGGLELTEIVLAGVIFCALPLVTYRGEHVVVDLISLSGRWVRLVQHVITNLIGVVGLVVLCQQMWLRGDRLTRTGETTIQIEIPMNLVAYGISCLFAVTAVAFLVRALIPDEYVRHGASGTGASSLETHID